MVAIDENWRMLNASFTVCFIVFLCAYILSIRTTERGSNIKKNKGKRSNNILLHKRASSKIGKK
jgi:putative exporter of polyketide antibiotics